LTGIFTRKTPVS